MSFEGLGTLQSLNYKSIQHTHPTTLFPLILRQIYSWRNWNVILSSHYIYHNVLWEVGLWDMNISWSARQNSSCCIIVPKLTQNILCTISSWQRCPYNLGVVSHLHECMYALREKRYARYWMRSVNSVDVTAELKSYRV